MPTNTAKIFLFLMAAGCWKQNSVKIFPLAQILAVKDATPVERRTNEGSDASNNPNHGSWLDKPKNGYIHAVKRLSLTTKPYFVFWPTYRLGYPIASSGRLFRPRVRFGFTTWFQGSLATELHTEWRSTKASMLAPGTSAIRATPSQS
ncbi:hypothetical protein H112_08920 [Trichophyton rubrum D6]|uniref:Secreted protein n=1 Tax=Trichophyton rubrum CBS 288.86 TaxID=1215330 RepID=A0A022VMT9_TRIRU|nr:hypothetical protein H100_08941 [Trichophyton rubrum MR850]EZF47239.1 hypothetical protein H103_08923 [Trichophyton rubrum CBS 288.86]EZF57816.1 hypothetical protein H104_08872 [Trichophyton rubrum CBS 289.86]EZF79105.1 hypothetical protein H110_08923 [Trichophyton rubrum MR1448]EZG00766.1 hypothetical protein H106_08793 [Trichophyton rubrum CBS 735.88]KDB28296.1 hypothetical protein H112_08920 [Trichophyton rubrum D6]KMQ43078.1 hypothetical protein HL42_6246 [Trichophyton rubrum]